MTIKQDPRESLKNYLMRFSQERLAAENQNVQFINCAMYLRKDGALMADLAWKPAKGLQEFLDRAEEFVNQKETLRAFLGVEGTSASKDNVDMNQNKKESKEVKRAAEQRSAKRLED